MANSERRKRMAGSLRDRGGIFFGENERNPAETRGRVVLRSVPSWVNEPERAGMRRMREVGNRAQGSGNRSEKLNFTEQAGTTGSLRVLPLKRGLADTTGHRAEARRLKRLKLLENLEIAHGRADSPTTAGLRPGPEPSILPSASAVCLSFIPYPYSCSLLPEKNGVRPEALSAKGSTWGLRG